MTQPRMNQHAFNILSWADGNFKNGSIPPSFETFFETQDKWARAQVAANPTDARWQAASYAIAQLDGLVAGYNSVAPSTEQRAMYDFQLLQASGDLLDLIPALTPAEAPQWHTMPAHEVMSAIRERSHCSAIIKVLGDLSEMFISHVAWFTYGSMLRVYKTYDFDVDTLPGRRTGFSSYPGLLSSLDDFYLNSPSKIGMVQTTNNVFNKELYKLVKPQSLWAWQRVRMANMIADDGATWADTIRADNSGTYNNAYMAVNFKLFKAGSALRNGTLWYTEQIPGLVMAEDVTNYLERGYWSSYNVPWFQEIYERSGYPSMVDRMSSAPAALGQLAGLDYQMAPRAQLFRRDANKVADMGTLQSLMRSNNYRTDPYAHDDPWQAICSRGDLASSPSAGGCYDGKTASSQMVDSLTAFVVNGPTTSDGQLPPFKWTPAFNSTAHVGQFEEFDFSWQQMTPAAL